MTPRIMRSDLPEKSSGKLGYPASQFRLFEDFFNDWATRTWRDAEGWTPPVDILEKDGNILLMLSLPGMSERDVDLKIEGQVLTVKGERKSQEGYGYHQTESFYGTFSRSFTLPDSVDLSSIKADYKNGILTITVPQKPEVRPRTIKISA